MSGQKRRTAAYFEAGTIWKQILYGIEGAGLILLLDWLFYQERAALPAFLWVIPVYIHIRREHDREERIHQRLLEFREILDSLSVSLRAGYSVENAIPETAGVLKKVLGNNNETTIAWNRIVQQMKLKAPADQLIMEFAVQSECGEIRSFAEVFTAARRTGGNLRAIVADTADSISRKIEVEEEIQTMLAAKKMEQRIMSLMPPGIIGYMRLTSPGYLDPLYHSVPGAAVMTICLLIWGAAIWWGSRIVKIEV